MTRQFLQNLANHNHSALASADATQCLPRVVGQGLIKRVIYRLKEKLTKAWDRQLREYEIHHATEHLYRLTDEQLRDMGITRMDIHHVVRHGKD